MLHLDKNTCNVFPPSSYFNVFCIVRLLSFSFKLSGIEGGSVGAAGCRFNHFEILRTGVRWYDDACFVLTFSDNNYMTPVRARNRVAVISSYRRMCKFAILIHFLALAVLYKNNTILSQY